MRRASSLPFAQFCGHASHLATIHPETSELAVGGSGKHAEIAAGILGDAEPTSEAGKAALAWVRAIVQALTRDGAAPTLSVESKVTLLDDEEHDYEILSEGTPDLAIETPEIVHVVDWKNSKWGNVPEPDRNPQLITYALAKANGRPFQVHLVFGDDADDGGNVRPRSSPIFQPEEHADLLAWIRTLANRDADPCYGRHCSGCYVSHYCEAYRARTVTALAVLEPTTEALTTDTAQALDERIELATAWLETAKAVRKDYVKAGGVLLRGGKQAHVVDVAGRETADCKALRAAGLEKYINTGEPSDRITWRKVKPQG